MYQRQPRQHSVSLLCYIAGAVCFVYMEPSVTTEGPPQSDLNRQTPEVGRAGCFGAVFQWCHPSQAKRLLHRLFVLDIFNLIRI